MRFIKPVSGGVELPELSNPAGASNIQAGYEAIGSGGEKITGTHEEAGLPVLTTPAEARHIKRDKQVIDANGNILTGTMYNDEVYTQEGYAMALSWVPDSEDNYCGTLTDSLGDATAADVVEGKTFTSAAGLKVAGTAILGATSITNLGTKNLTASGISIDMTNVKFVILTGKSYSTSTSSKKLIGLTLFDSKGNRLVCDMTYGSYVFSGSLTLTINGTTGTLKADSNCYCDVWVLK